MTAETILSFENLDVSFKTDEGMIKVLDGVSFKLEKGRTLGLVGESGSGKSVSTRCAVQLNARNIRIGAGSRIVLTEQDGTQTDVLSLKPNSRKIRDIRGGEIGMIFQEPMASFSPVYTIGNQMVEAIRLHRDASKKQARELAIEMLRKVGISSPEQRIDQYPGELSGGMRQRAMIALALSTNPNVLIADEPTTALDVTIQAQVLDLMRSLQQELEMSIIFITHDLGVVSQVAHDIAVMYLGKVVEYGSTKEVLKNPQHPYTQGLLKALPNVDHLEDRLSPVGGDIPSPLERPTGCPFHTRCPQAISGLCASSMPAPTQLTDKHEVSCHLLTQQEAAS
ncbi:ABC transporter ATP-binding protein [Kiloniella sp. b19]|uniref:ABC transporter ATP-binding protein n=1 Tax=Kiloniella sp. GXU_MW_B19 TaxID=3141326 RepID=UPI0031DC0A34